MTKIQIEEVFITRSIRIWAYQEIGDKEINFYYDPNQGGLIQTEHNRNTWSDDRRPLIELPWDIFGHLMDGIHKYANETGRKPESEGKLEGKIIAMTDHIASLKSYSEGYLEIMNALISKLP